MAKKSKSKARPRSDKPLFMRILVLAMAGIIVVGLIASAVISSIM